MVTPPNQQAADVYSLFLRVPQPMETAKLRQPLLDIFTTLRGAFLEGQDHWQFDISRIDPQDLSDSRGQVAAAIRRVQQLYEWSDPSSGSVFPTVFTSSLGVLDLQLLTLSTFDFQSQFSKYRETLRNQTEVIGEIAYRQIRKLSDRHEGILWTANPKAVSSR